MSSDSGPPGLSTSSSLDSKLSVVDDVSSGEGVDDSSSSDEHSSSSGVSDSLESESLLSLDPGPLSVDA